MSPRAAAAAVAAVALVALCAQGTALAVADELTAPAAASVVEAAGAGDVTDASASSDAAAAAGELVEQTAPAELSAEPSGGPVGQPAEAAEPGADVDETLPAGPEPVGGSASADEEPDAAATPTALAAGATESGSPASLGDPVALANARPIGVDDFYTLGVDTVLTVGAPGLLGNDFDAEGDFITTQQSYLQTTQGGHVRTYWDRSFTYTPAPGFVGTDSWSYWPQDASGQSAVATNVSFTVVDTTDLAPVANDDSYATSVSTPLAVPGIGVLGNDTDADGDALYIPTILAQGGALATAKGGTVDWFQAGGLVYEPAQGFIGYDTFTYWATDDVLDSYLATVTVKVGDWANLPPVPLDDQYATAANHLLTVTAADGLLANDSDAEDALQVVVPHMLHTGRGTVTLQTDGSFTYASSSYDTLGPDTFTYQVTDGSHNLPVTASVTIDVTAFANTAPTTVDDLYATTIGQGFGVGKSTGLLANDSDADQDQLHVVAGQVDAPTDAGGTVNIGDNGSFSYTPPAGFVGVDHFTYEATDGWTGGLTLGDAFVTVTDPGAVGGANSMPVASDDHYTALPDTTLVVSGADGVLNNDFDADGDSIISVIPDLPYGASTVAGGTVTGTSDGGFTYSPPAGFVGEDQFVYAVLDQAVESFDIGTVFISVAVTPTSTTEAPQRSSGDEGALASTGVDLGQALVVSLSVLLTGAIGISAAAAGRRRIRRA